jgi:glycosyltransferase involved in cell wall biosynthesis
VQLSVAMCTYNGALYLRDQLNSIAAQTCAPHELIICDDQSTDETRNIIRSFASYASFPVRLHVNESRLGVIHNFEQAIRRCAGDIIALADQDDVWREEKLQRIAEAFSTRREIGLVLSNAEVVNENMRPLGYGLWDSTFTLKEQKLFNKGKAFSVLSTHNVATGATMAFRAKYKELILPIPDDIALIHDGWIATLIAAVDEVALIHAPLIKYRQHTRQQLGIKPPGTEPSSKRFFGEQRAHTAALGKAYFLADITRLGKIHERLLAMNGAFDGAKAIADIEARIKHLHARVLMNDKRLKRVPSILKELLSRRYHLYSKGARSAARDFWL